MTVPPRVLGRQPRDLRWDELVAAAQVLGPDPALRDVDDVTLARQVREGAVAIAAATARWLELVAELVVRGVWAEEGASSPAQWLGWACGMGASTAREHVRVALRLRELPHIRAAFTAGSVSYSKVRAITRVAEPSFEHTLLTWCDAAPAAVIERTVATWRRQATHATTTPAQQAARRNVSRRERPDGMVEVVLVVHPDEADLLLAQLDRLVEVERAAAQPASAEAPRRHRGSERVDAALHAVTQAIHAGPADTSGMDRHTLVVTTHLDQLNDPTTPAPLRHLGCDTAVVALLAHDHGHVAAGPRVRTPSAALRRALHQRDRHCRYPGCTTTRHLHAHHVVHWADGGPTTLANLVLLCGHHHRHVHTTDVTIRHDGHGHLTFLADDEPTNPGWNASAEAPRLPPTDHSTTGRLAALRLQPALWDGRPADLDALLYAVHDLVERSRTPTIDITTTLTTTLATAA